MLLNDIGFKTFKIFKHIKWNNTESESQMMIEWVVVWLPNKTKVKKCVKMYFLELTDDAVMASLEYGSANRHQMADRSSVTEALLQNFCCRMLQL